MAGISGASARPASTATPWTSTGRSSALAKNALQYGAAAKAVVQEVAILRYVASDGNA